MIATASLKEGMIIAKDIFSHHGTLLIPEHTSLSPNHIIKINIYSIHQVSVYVEDTYKGPIIEDPYDKFDREMTLIHTTQEKENSFGTTPEFQAFTKKYNDQLGQVESQLKAIVHSKEIVAAPLNDLVTDILTATNTGHLFSFMCRMKSSDDVTYSHSLNVSMLASILGKWLNLPIQTTTELAIAGLLHDIGKINVNQTILNKSGKLTPEEFDHIKQHTTLGYQLVADTTLPLGVKHAILMHHEKMNGGGYPLGLNLHRIHDYAKIISIVDIYDAMTAERPYHKRYHPFHVIRMFEEECYGVLDTTYLEVFLERIAHNFLEDQVLLSNHKKAKIIFIHPRNPSNPIVQLTNGKIIDLQNNQELAIIDFL